MSNGGLKCCPTEESCYGNDKCGAHPAPCWLRHHQDMPIFDPFTTRGANLSAEQSQNGRLGIQYSDSVLVLCFTTSFLVSHAPLRSKQRASHRDRRGPVPST